MNGYLALSMAVATLGWALVQYDPGAFDRLRTDLSIAQLREALRDSRNERWNREEDG